MGRFFFLFIVIVISLHSVSCMSDNMTDKSEDKIKYNQKTLSYWLRVF